MEEECRNVHKFNTSAGQCNFVKNNSDCQDHGGYLNYIEGYYCQLHDYQYSAVVLYIIWLIILFVAMGLATDDYFCPNLATISKLLRLSQNVSGVTLLAFGNGAADIFSSIAGMSQNRPELVLGELFGAAAFLTSAVAGEEVRWYDSIGFLILYVIYIAVVLIGRCIHQRLRIVVSDSQQSQTSESTSYQISEDSHDNEPLDDQSVESYFIVNENPRGFRSVSDIVRMDEISEHVTSSPNLNRSQGGWGHFCSELLPARNLRAMSIPRMFWNLLKFPLLFIFNLTIPVVVGEEDSSNSSRWCQKLNVLQTILGTMFMAFATKLAFVPVGKSELHAWDLSIYLSLLLGILILCTSKESHRPVYYTLFAFYGFCSSIVWIYVLANEIVSLIKTFGVLFGLSDAILGMTVLAWGNSVGDLVADISVSRQGFPRMGFSACIGGPLFNLLLGIGIPFTLTIARNHWKSIPLQYNKMVLVLYATFTASLAGGLILIILSGFRGNRTVGYILLGLYFVTLSVALIVEFAVL